jgi:type II secretory pathway predicted ATPase ExeA
MRMLSEVMAHYGLTRELDHVGYFETAHHQHMMSEIKSAVKQGKLVALSGIVGCGKTTTLHHIQALLANDQNILVSKSLAVDKDRVNLGTLILALFYDLSTEKEVKVPTQAEKRERQLLDLIQKRRKTVALFIDEAHDLHGQTLLRLKRLMELVRANGGKLSVILAGHPKLTNDLRRASMEEIGSRATVFMLDGVKGEQEAYITWLLEQCTQADQALDELITDEAMALLVERLSTPLQIEYYLSRAFEEGYRAGQKPITPEVINMALVNDLDDLEPRLTRHGYHVKALSEVLNVRPREIRSFLQGRLPPSRTQELQQEMLAVGIPL